MRPLLSVVLAWFVPVSVAWSCPAPQPTRSELILLTAATATLPPDGAILVTHRQVAIQNHTEATSTAWTVRDAAGRKIKLTVEDLGSGVERWIPASPATRTLVILDETGKRIATLHQTKANSTEPLSAPTARSISSSVSLDQARVFPGVIGGTTVVELSKDPPAHGRFLAIAITGASGYVHSAMELRSASQRTFQATSYARKSCASSRGPGPLFIGQHVGLRWIDELGRVSPTTQVTVAQLALR